MNFLSDPVFYVYLALSMAFVVGFLWALNQIIYWAILKALRKLQAEGNLQVRNSRKK